MNAYLFTAIATLFQVRATQGGRYSGATESLQSWDACTNLIVFGVNSNAAQKRFEESLYRQPEGEHPLEVHIKTITSAQFEDKLFTESGPTSLLWPDVLKQTQEQAEATSTDDFEQGYWVDANAVVPPGQQASNVQSLQQNLPEDIANGMNWSADKQFYYLLTVLSPPALPPQNLDGEPDEDAIIAAKELEQLLMTYPQGAKKESVALIQARNSVVAAWLWRRHVASAPLSKFQIRIDPWCHALGSA
jgi:hypothetical protein